MLNNKWGMCKYFFLRNDKVWKRLTGDEKKIILESNRLHNISRDDYKNPERYGAGRLLGGENWDSSAKRAGFHRGRVLNQILEVYQPGAVLEIGPGAGFFTRLICEKNYVKRYVAIDIAKAFLDFLEARLNLLKTKKEEFNFELVCDDFMNVSFSAPFDLVVLLSTVHHIPNRDDLFQKLSQFLRKGGKIFCIDPSHYLPRFYHLIRRMPQYLRKSYYLKKENISTHHMCTCGEYVKAAGNANLTIEQEWYILPKKYFGNKIIKGHSWLRICSFEIGILLKK